VRAARAGLFLLIMGFGGVVETAWQVREHVPGGTRFGWRMFRGRYDGPSHPFEQAPHTVPLPAGTAVRVENEFGAVRVAAGQAAEARVVLRTVVYEPSAEKARAFASHVRLDTRTENGVLHIGTNRREVERGDTGFETHLEIQLPAGTALQLRNEHGETSVADVGSLDLEAGFEAVDVQRVQGDARLQVRHADTSIGDVSGALQLTVRHGDLAAARVKGATRLDLEHGRAELEDTASLHASTRHATVRAVRVGGGLEVQGEHTEVDATGVQGPATVRTSFQNVALTDVTGDAILENQNGGVKLLRVGGRVEATTRHDDVELDTIGGPVKVTVQNGGVAARGLAQGGEIQASHDAIDVDGWSGALSVAGENTSVHLESGQPLSGRLEVRTSHDDLKLDLPAGAPLEISARAEHGDVRVELPGLSTTTSTSDFVAGRVGSGGPAVSLQATNGTIVVSTTGATR
jgi:hypothetical protein